MERPAGVLKPVEVKTGKKNSFNFCSMSRQKLFLITPKYAAGLLIDHVYTRATAAGFSAAQGCLHPIFHSVVEPSTQSSDEQQLIKINPCGNATGPDETASRCQGVTGNLYI